MANREYADYKAKQQILDECLTRVTPREFYDDIFPDADLERPGCPDDRRANMIIAYSVVSKSGKAGFRNEVVFAGKEGLKHAEKSVFALCGMCTFSGRRRTAKNAYKCYGFAFDLDGVGKEECETFLLGVSIKKLPCPQYIVNSGHGLHLYYLFPQPVPLYPSVRDYLQRLKMALTRVVWTNETSYIKSRPNKDMRDYLGIYQNMRMPGSCSKIGRGKARTKYLVTAYRYNTYLGARSSLSYLNSWVPEAYRVPDSADYSEWSSDRLTLDQAREEYPEWYQKRIVEQRPPAQWVCSKGLYDWWLRRIQEDDGARDGTRYNCIATLFIYAVKCNVQKDIVMADALALVEPFNMRTVKPDNEFTADDVQAASKYYKRSFARYPIRAIEAKTHIMLPRNKRNGRPQKVHMGLISTMRDYLHPDGSWRNKDGRPKGSGTKQQQVQAWRKEHPDGKKADCERETGLSRHTILKWWAPQK